MSGRRWRANWSVAAGRWAARVSLCGGLLLAAIARAADAPVAEPPAREAPAADAVGAALAAHVGQMLDVVELSTGRRIVRPRLERVVERNGKTESLRIVEEGQSRSTAVLLKGITKIVAGRETVYEAETKGGGAAGARGRIARERRAAELAESRQRMEARNVEPWPDLTAEEHAAAVGELEAFVDEVRQAFPQLVVSETHEFLVATDIAPREIAPYVANLDSMHDLLCDLYGIPRGEPVWQGKCLVVAFRQQADFQAFEQRFMKVAAPEGIYGLCHQFSTGRVITACHRGDEASSFAHMLVHETSHGFNFRWLSPELLPNWLNEGIAEWVGTQVVPNARVMPIKEAQARAFMLQTGSLGPDFFTAANIQSVQYGIASQLVKFLLARDRRKFVQFVRGIKEGMTPEESLEAAYQGSLADLIAAFGQSLGVPQLKP
jgi:hypothetical protein